MLSAKQPLLVQQFLRFPTIFQTPQGLLPNLSGISCVLEQLNCRTGPGNSPPPQIQPQSNQTRVPCARNHQQSIQRHFWRHADSNTGPGVTVVSVHYTSQGQTPSLGLVLTWGEKANRWRQHDAPLNDTLQTLSGA